MRVRRQDVIGRACKLGLSVDTYGPGDGLTRYRFFAVPTDYFAGDSLGTVLGLKSAMIWLDGFEAGAMIWLDGFEAGAMIWLNGFEAGCEAEGERHR